MSDRSELHRNIRALRRAQRAAKRANRRLDAALAPLFWLRVEADTDAHTYAAGTYGARPFVTRAPITSG